MIRGDIMGFLNKMKEAGEIGRNHEWKLGMHPILLTLEDSFIHIKGGGKEITIFYKDIQKLNNKGTAIEIKTITDKYQIIPKKLRGATGKVDELYAQILEKMNTQKAPQSVQVPNNDSSNTPSFCGNCGQALSGENFCPNCGTEVRKS